MVFITGRSLESGITYIYSTHTFIKQYTTEFLQMHFSTNKNCMIMRFTIYIIHQTSLQHSKKETEMGKTRSMDGGGVMQNEYNISTGKYEGKIICG